MSLKAKIEAVIYAAEEPVTLAQLLGLLGGEAQAELDRLRDRQARLALEEASLAAGSLSVADIPPANEPDLLNDEILDFEDEQEDDSGTEQTELPEPSEAVPVTADQFPDELASRETDTADADPAEADVASTSRAETELAAPPETPELNPRERDRLLRDYLRDLLAELVRDYSRDDRGLEIREVAGGFRFSTKPEYHDAVRGFVKSLKPPLKLTLQALETLAVVAYKQPVTAPEISEIRGVDSAGVLGSLLARKLITTAGRKQVIGRPILYKTTKDFLLRFGLKDASELPSIEEFEKMAGELAEQEEIPMDSIDSTPVLGAESPHTDPELVHGLSGVASPGSDVIGTGDDGGSLDQAPASGFPPAQGDATEPQADGDSSPADQVSTDGRLSGITRAGNRDVPVDSPAGDAAIQSETEREA